jgi:uncharacterized membrane protein
MMARIERSIEVDVPVRTAYNQWTQFEEFPQFMEGIKHVRQLDDRRLSWHAEVMGRDETWEAEITDQVPDERIAWRSLSGARNDGMVTFAPLGPERTRVMLTIDYTPEDAVEKAGSALGVVTARVDGDLRRFKEFIERRGVETGAWRGEIREGEAEHSRVPRRR